MAQGAKQLAGEPAPHARRADISTAPEALAAPLRSLSYRSRSVGPMSELELHRLAKSAQARNQSEGVTGLLVYDNGWIFQQLEGPAEGLARIWESIQRDSRHEGIELLEQVPLDERRFQDWSLKLSIHGAEAGRVPPDPEALGQAREALSGLIRTVLVPTLVKTLPRPVRDADAGSLACLLISSDQQAAVALVRAAQERDGALETLALEVIEPAARRLGDLWQADQCTDVDVTLGLWRLQQVVRDLGLGATRVHKPDAPVVLVVPHPGETHLLGAALDTEMLWLAGWSPKVEFPADAATLDGLVAGTWIDALDVSLSTALGREHRLPQLAETIAHARLASMNPDLVVVVSGRYFVDELGRKSAGDVGADASFGSAAEVEAAILDALQRR
jgi:hypothetical protein